MIQSFSAFQDFIQENDAVLAYFSHHECSVCKILKPKVKQLLEDRFPNIKFMDVNIKETPEISAQQRIFAVPTLVAYFEGREFIRKSRNIGLEELRQELERPYSLMFS